MKDVQAKVRVDAGRKKRFTIQFGAEKDGKRAARVGGKSVILLFSKNTADALTPPLKNLKKKVEKPKEKKTEEKPKEAKPEKAKPEEEKAEEETH